MTPTLSLIVATVLTLLMATIWLRINDFLASRGIISGQLSRKIIHTGTGPIFVLCWLLFPEHPWSRYLAAIVPLLITVKFALVGLGVIQDEAEVASLTRHGDRREILYGPLFYGIAFVLVTIAYWCDNVIGIIALMMLCGGDGLADIVGRRFNSVRLPWSKTKSLAGSLAMFVGGICFSLVVLWVFINAGKFDLSLSHLVLPVSLIGLGCTLAESLPLRDFDNVTVVVTALISGQILFK